MTRRACFRRTIGRRGGGPGELGAIRSIYVGPGDTLHVFDQTSLTHTVIDPAHDLVRAVTLGIGPEDAVQIAPGKLIVSAVVPSRAGFGYPLHTVETDRIVRHLGEPILSRNSSAASL